MWHSTYTQLYSSILKRKIYVISKERKCFYQMQNLNLFSFHIN